MGWLLDLRSCLKSGLFSNQPLFDTQITDPHCINHLFAGLATFLNSHSIHRTRYHSVGLSIRNVCPGNEAHCTNPEVELSQVTFKRDPSKPFLNTVGAVTLQSVIG